MAAAQLEFKVLVTTGAQVLYRVGQSVDGNASWTILNYGVGLNDLARDPAWEDRLFGADGGGVLVSLDGGVTWTAAPTGATNCISVVAR